MVRVYGAPYVKNNTQRHSSCPPRSHNTCPPRSCPPPPCNPGRVIYTGPSYVRSSWSNRFIPWSVTPPAQHVYVETTPSPTVIVESRPRQVAVIHHSQDDDRAARAVAVAVIALAIIVIVAIAISSSRDCHLIQTICSFNEYGVEICQDVWECRW